jgi:hypothetical protein
MKEFCICTLTHNAPDRASALKLTIKTFAESFVGSRFKWFVLINVTNPDIDKVIEEAIKSYCDLIDFEIHINIKNTGPGAGINQLNRLSKDYKYSLFLEGDWMCIPNNITGFTGGWLYNSVKLLDENPKIDQVQFRRYLDDLDDRQYGYSYWITPDNVEKEVYNGETFVILKEREYVNTPTLRRMSAYYDKGIFPLKEHYDTNGNSLEIKGNDEWGMAEINACETGKLNGAWLKFGNFVHYEHFPIKENWDLWINSNKGCNSFKSIGKNSCKYGYMFFTESFCAICSKNTDYTDLERHSKVWIEDVLGMFDKNLTDDEVILSMIQMTEDPVYNVNTYIDKKTYRKLTYNRNLN